MYSTWRRKNYIQGTQCLCKKIKTIFKLMYSIKYIFTRIMYSSEFLRIQMAWIHIDNLWNRTAFIDTTKKEKNTTRTNTIQKKKTWNSNFLGFSSVTMRRYEQVYEKEYRSNSSNWSLSNGTENDTKIFLIKFDRIYRIVMLFLFLIAQYTLSTSIWDQKKIKMYKSWMIKRKP